MCAVMLRHCWVAETFITNFFDATYVINVQLLCRELLNRHACQHGFFRFYKNHPQIIVVGPYTLNYRFSEIDLGKEGKDSAVWYLVVDGDSVCLKQFLNAWCLLLRMHSWFLLFHLCTLAPDATKFSDFGNKWLHKTDWKDECVQIARWCAAQDTK